MTKFSDKVMEIVAGYTGHVFVLPGGFSMHLNDSLNHNPNLEAVYCLHESACGFSAIGYSHITGGLGVCLVTSGPGCTNVLTAVASAYQDSVPLLIVSGEAKLENIKKRETLQLRQGGAQDVPIEKIASHITKSAKTVTDIKQVKAGIETALSDRRGPVWLAIPLDVQAVEV
jgi:acetolactate synthase-1/2/3 large subunit